MEPVTPQAPLNLFNRLSKEDKAAFLERLGETVTAEDVLMVIAGLTTIERGRLSDIWCNGLVDSFYPIILRETLRLVKESPEASQDDLEGRVREAVEAIQKSLVELELAQFCEKRDRPSAPENVRRFVEICDLRLRNKKTYSHRKLAQMFDISRQRVKDILDEEAKWRRLAAKEATN